MIWDERQRGLLSQLWELYDQGLKSFVVADSRAGTTLILGRDKADGKQVEIDVDSPDILRLKMAAY